MYMTELGSSRHHTAAGSAELRTRHHEEIDPLLMLHRRVNKLFDDIFRGALHDSDVTPFGFNGDRGWPQVEVAKTEKEVKVTVELPGLDEKDVRVALAGDTLVIEGEKERETEDKNRWFSERHYGHFERRIPLNWQVEEDRIAASFRNGILTVTLPTSAKAQEHVKRIHVNNGG
jgi:HSP20 family protein